MNFDPRKLILPTLLVVFLVDMTANTVACRTSSASKPDAFMAKPDARSVERLKALPAPYGVPFGVLVDGSTPNDCGATHAQCGIWNCSGPYSPNLNLANCVVGATGCTYGDASGVDGAVIECAYRGTELSNAVLGSAAQQVPGGVFCPGVPFSINILIDQNNCGACSNKCPLAYQCLTGVCTP
jgi:hypothetical protein